MKTAEKIVWCKQIIQKKVDEIQLVTHSFQFIYMAQNPKNIISVRDSQLLFTILENGSFIDDIP